ncbi:GNAT family N-acetyltransferase [Cytobacillus purgationiresistens]|uniref:RimJ/RimL family protein N-acetyltransferase n=1 Tax=Cytobacillus purgationiresistens TaxID=863449 RepID=A0ABU0ANE7_9BACI|nr:GNAT family N-acetyltransferase [Cytobacillus purgationiresistens]MDQ0272777.1 RimJ/RimL family protein N-acetyltransferase [Cytobacillus purgationiresistens]
MHIREAIVGDGENLAILIKQVEAQSEYMLMEAGERKLSVEQQQKMIDRFNRSGNSAILLAETDEQQLVGYIIIVGGTAKRTLHSAYLVVGILKDYCGMGVGTSLFQHLDQWAREKELSRLELTVVTENEAAVSLYKKSGFDIEGVKRGSFVKDGEFFDEYYMGKLI